MGVRFVNQFWFLFGIQGLEDGFECNFNIMNFDKHMGKKLFYDHMVTPVFKHTIHDPKYMVNEFGEIDINTFKANEDCQIDENNDFSAFE